MVNSPRRYVSSIIIVVENELSVTPQPCRALSICSGLLQLLHQMIWYPRLDAQAW